MNDDIIFTETDRLILRRFKAIPHKPLKIRKNNGII